MDKKDDKKSKKSDSPIEEEIQNQISRRKFLKDMGRWSGIVGALFSVPVAASLTSPLISGCYQDGPGGCGGYYDYSVSYNVPYSRYYNMVSYYHTYYSHTVYYYHYHTVYYYHYSTVYYSRYSLPTGKQEPIKEICGERKAIKERVPVGEKSEGATYCNYFDYADSMGK